MGIYVNTYMNNLAALEANMESHYTKVHPL